MNECEAALLAAGARSVGVELDGFQASQLLDYLDELYRWNPSAGLTTVPRKDAVRLHLLDSLAAAPLLEGVGSIVDLGSGAGLPGIPLAVALPGVSIDLVESRRRRASFLWHAISRLGLKHCRVLQEDAFALPGRGRRYHGVVSRAFVSPRQLLEIGARLVESNGTVVVMAGPSLSAAVLRAAAKQEGFVLVGQRSLVLPGGSERRLLLKFQRACAR